ncbi:hypothetical protein [Salinarchaeum sp. Harcht-Bsk1]|uniref:hypothetical protein n=1 Tax=Salinarchaeum sp. Harcht-Bsk1 TaxID=1333523 RepID=UPI0011819B8F|nr:hypothetical protein [Salinarchaeum sp. Harcht-Bsk1]
MLGDRSLTADTPSQTRLERAHRDLRDEFRESGSESDVSKLTSRLLYDFEIDVVEVDDDAGAASIFESTDDRGKPLSSLEDTKSFLMNVDDRAAVDRSLRNESNDRFGGLYRELFVLEDGHSHVDDFDEDSLQQSTGALYDGFDADEYCNNFDTLQQPLYEPYRYADHDDVTRSCGRELAQGASPHQSNRFLSPRIRRR